VNDENLVRSLTEDYSRAPISDTDRALLDYAVKLTREPWTVEREDTDTLRQAGLSDAAILDLNLVVSYFAFVNRLADGLGVELEPSADDPDA
jgi:uncharacterized peroxidase-related enzyme